MKILSYSLFCFLFGFLGMCGDETCLSKDDDYIDISCIVKVTIVDKDNGINCGPYTVVFQKHHYGGTWSDQMKYDFKGCYVDAEVTYIGREQVPDHVVDMKTEDDYLVFYLFDDSDNVLTTYEYGANRIKADTHSG
jgi:hypothetical protein